MHGHARSGWPEPVEATSPDGTRLAISAGVDLGGGRTSGRIHVYDLLGGMRTELTEGYHWAPEWSPDCRQIAFVGQPDSSSRVLEHILVMDMTTSDVVDLSIPTWDQRREPPYFDRDPSWTATNWGSE